MKQLKSCLQIVMNYYKISQRDLTIDKNNRVDNIKINYGIQLYDAAISKIKKNQEFAVYYDFVNAYCYYRNLDYNYNKLIKGEKQHKKKILVDMENVLQGTLKSNNIINNLT